MHAAWLPSPVTRRLGAPADGRLLLRCINPSEAALVQDRASGAVVRFRLGGSVFPPIVYYKVYLRNPVTDLGSFAPRDYTVGKPDQFYMLRRHNDGCQNEARAQSVRDVTHQVDTSLWYHRFENNGWRPIANKHLHAHDQVTRSTAARRNADFHHVAEVRRMMATTKRDHKKAQWMQRMYKPPQQTASTTAGDLGWEDLDIDEVSRPDARCAQAVCSPANACVPSLVPGISGPRSLSSILFRRRKQKCKNFSIGWISMTTSATGSRSRRRYLAPTSSAPARDKTNQDARVQPPAGSQSTQERCEPIHSLILSYSFVPVCFQEMVPPNT